MNVNLKFREKKVSSLACSRFNKLCGTNKRESEIRSIINSSSKRYHMCNIGLRKGLDGSDVVHYSVSYRCIILDGYATTFNEQVIAWQKIAENGKYLGLHISSEKKFKQMISKNESNTIGIVVFDNWQKQKLFFEFIKKICVNQITK